MGRYAPRAEGNERPGRCLAIPLSRASPMRAIFTLIVANWGRLIPAGGQIYDTRGTSDESGIYVAGTFRRAINDSRSRGGDALALPFIALSDPYQNDDSSGRLATRFLKDSPLVGRGRLWRVFFSAAGG